MIKAVFFDLDGTVADTLSDLAQSGNYTLKKFGFPTHVADKYKYFGGDGIPKLVERMLPEENRDVNTKASALNIFLNHYNEHFADTTTPFADVTDLLNQLKQKGYIIAIISNKADYMTQKVVEKLFPNTFDLVCGKLENYPTKPDPALFCHLAEELNVKPNECIIVGDSGMDMKTAANSGATGIGVLWGFREKSELLENGANYIIEKPLQLLDVLGEING